MRSRLWYVVTAGSPALGAVAGDHGAPEAPLGSNARLITLPAYVVLDLG